MISEELFDRVERAIDEDGRFVRTGTAWLVVDRIGVTVKVPVRLKHIRGVAVRRQRSIAIHDTCVCVDDYHAAARAAVDRLCRGLDTWAQAIA